MKTKIYCPDIECDSCVKVISKALDKQEGVHSFNIKSDFVEIEFDASKVQPLTLISVIQNKGYRAGLNPFDRKTFGERFRDFRNNKEKYAVEYTMIKYSFLVFVGLVLIELLAYGAYFKTMPNFINKYAWWIFYTNLAVVSIGSAVWHLKSYKAEVTCMTGMMIGMTFGMQTGMMLGTIIGATNGLFMGGMAGMLLGVGIGFYNGKCCGVMGMMEGMMAGTMGGPMGAMIGTMFFVDNILWFMPFFMAINLAIMAGLSYMLYEEMVEDKPKIQKKPIDFMTFFSYCLLFTAILIGIMVFGMKTGVAGIGG